MTSQQVCVGSAGRPMPQGLEDGQRALRRKAVRKTESPKVWRQKHGDLRARVEALEKKKGEGAQGRQGLPSRRERGLKEEWREDMDIEDETESRKKLDDQKKKLHKELRGVERLQLVSKEAQGNIKESLQQQLHEVENRRHDPHARASKSVEKITKDTKHPG